MDRSCFSVKAQMRIRTLLTGVIVCHSREAWNPDLLMVLDPASIRACPEQKKARPELAVALSVIEGVAEGPNGCGMSILKVRLKKHLPLPSVVP